MTIRKSLKDLTRFLKANRIEEFEGALQQEDGGLHHYRIRLSPLAFIEKQKPIKNNQSAPDKVGDDDLYYSATKFKVK